MNTTTILLHIVVSCLLLTVGVASGQTSFTSYAPSQYTGGDPLQLSEMEARLGIAGMDIEDFANDELLPSLSFEGSGVGSVIPQGYGWGSPSSGFIRFSTVGTQTATIRLESGATKVGVGFSAFESGTQGIVTSITVNGGETYDLVEALLPAFEFTHTYRNGYVVIESVDPIETLTFTTRGALDSYHLDYIAIPEPATTSLLALGGLALLRRRRAGRNL